ASTQRPSVASHDKSSLQSSCHRPNSRPLTHMPPRTDSQSVPSANKRRIAALVAATVKVLDRPAAAAEPVRSPIERDSVRSKLRLNRASGLLPLETIRPDPQQPRKVDTSSEDFRELVASVKTHGVLQPITVRHVEDGNYFR